MDTQAFRRSLHHSDRYNRRGFDSPTKRAQALEEAYQSDLISSIRDNNFTYTKGRLNIKLAQAFGFCWGVERAVSLFLKKIGFKTFGWSRTKKTIDGIRCLHGNNGLKEVLKKSEILILLLPLTKDTRFILNNYSLSLLPRRSQIINAGRGELIEDTALIENLRSGHILNATLDVFQQEPLPREHPYWILPNVTVTPHIAADTPVESSSKVLASNIKDLIEGKLPNGVVDLNKGY